MTVEVRHRLRGIQQDGRRLSSSLPALDICLLPGECSVSTVDVALYIDLSELGKTVSSMFYTCVKLASFLCSSLCSHNFIVVVN